jgi:hypothetical protein
LAQFPKEDRAELAAALRPRRYKRGEIVFLRF